MCFLRFGNMLALAQASIASIDAIVNIAMALYNGDSDPCIRLASERNHTLAPCLILEEINLPDFGTGICSPQRDLRAMSVPRLDTGEIEMLGGENLPRVGANGLEAGSHRFLTCTSAGGCRLQLVSDFVVKRVQNHGLGPFLFRIGSGEPKQ
ncbi:MAG: hypothetical protein NTW50_05690 [Candidatus Berkelbacteria bacterium]|nr:hypothetical protein [Candidatus Berkelbacteria bacterium]